MLKGTYVNLVDLVDARRTNETVEVFSSREKLSQYIILTDKTFSLKKAKTSPLLEQFLIHVFSGIARHR